MKVEANDGGGETVILGSGDALSDIPRSHRYLVDPSIEEIFPDPKQWLVRTASECEFSMMARWFGVLLQEDRWELHLHRGHRKEFSMAGFEWQSDSVTTATIAGPTNGDLDEYPEPIQRFYSLVRFVHWGGFGASGGLEAAVEQVALGRLGFEAQDAWSTFVFGHSASGDMLIYSLDGRSGWLNHATRQLHLLGSISDTINWCFAELLAGTTPYLNQ